MKPRRSSSAAIAAPMPRLAPVIARPGADVIDLHVYTFNQVASTEAWRRDYLAALDSDVAVGAGGAPG